MTDMHLRAGLDRIFAKDFPYKISTEGNEKILAPLATKKRVSIDEFVTFEESALKKMNIQRFCFNDKYKSKHSGVEFTITPEVLIFPKLGVCIIKMKTEIPSIITSEQYKRIVTGASRKKLKYSYRGTTVEGTFRDLEEKIFKYVEKKIKKRYKKIRDAHQELLIDADLYLGRIYEMKLGGKPVRFDALRRELYKGGKMSQRVAQLARRSWDTLEDVEIKEMLSNECSFSKDTILLPWYRGNLAFLSATISVRNFRGDALYENLVLSLEIVNAYHALLLIYCSIVSEQIEKAQNLLTQIADKESFKGLELAERAKKVKEILEQYKELVNNLNMLKMGALRSLLELKNPRLLARWSTTIRFFGAAAKETYTLDFMNSLERMINEFEVTCNRIMELISSEYRDWESKARHEQTMRVTRAMRALSLIFSGAVGLSIAKLIQGGTIMGFVISEWLALAIGLALWLIIAYGSLTAIRRYLRKVGVED